MFDFYYSHGGSRRKTFKSKGEVCSIGSARSNDLVIETKAIAKRHVELRLLPSGVHIVDLGSLSGTWVNRERVKQYGPLSDLDEIVVGDVSVVLDGMPVISDELLNTSSMGGGIEKHESNPKLSKFEEEEPVAVKPKRGGLFSLFSSQPEEDEEDDQLEARTNARANTANPESEYESKESLTKFADEGSAVSCDISLKANRVDSESSPRAENHDNLLESQVSSQPISQPSAIDERASHTNTATHDHLVDESPVRQSQQELDKSPAVESAFTEADEQIVFWSRVIHEQLLNQMDLRRKDVSRMTDDQLRDESEALIVRIVDSLDDDIPETVDLDRLRTSVLNEAVGLGPLEQFLEDDAVTEIMVNNHAEIFVEKDGKLVRSQHQFSSDATVYSVIERIITPLGRRIDESSPIVDARLKDGSRVNAVIPPLALKGPSLTIRKFPKYRMQFSDLVKFGSTNQQMVDFFQVCVESHKNIIVAGGTGSGKTTLLNVLSNFIPDEDRIVTIEDAAELSLAQPNLVSLESRPPNLEGKGDVPIRDLVKNSLRMRPDRIVIGECRGGEAIDMLQAMNTGHDGSLTTIHANTPRDVISRLEVLVLMAGLDLPVAAIREQVASAVHMIVQQTRFPCGSRKITKVTEVVGIESGTVQLQDIFEYKQQGMGPDGKIKGVFRPTGFIPTFYDELRQMGMEVDISVFNNSRASEV